MAHDDDRAYGVDERGVIVASIGALWVAGWGAIGWWQAAPVGVVAISVVLIAIGTALVLRRRQELLGTRVNRQITWVCLVAMLAQILVGVSGWLTAAPASDMLLFLLLAWAAVKSCGAVIIDRRFWPAALFDAAVYLVCSRQPQLLRYALGASALAVLVNMLVINRMIAREARCKTH